MAKRKEIYLDYASATPVDPRVLKVVADTQNKFWQNPSSIHKSGVAAAKTLNFFRKKVADILYAHPDEIVFTSGGSESNNLAIFGVLKSFENKKPTILVSSIDHPSIIEPAKSFLKKANVKFLPVEESGLIDLKILNQELKKQPVLLSFGYANGEVGTIQNVREIMKIVRFHRKENKTPYPYVHIDATQAANVVSVEVHKLGIDLMTLDGSKIYGPKGIGMLYIRRGVVLKPMIVGGGQEEGFRSGTENLSAIAGFSEALSIAQKDREKTYKYLSRLHNKFIKNVLQKYPNASLNGPKDLNGKPEFTNKHPGIVNICFPKTDSEQLVLILDSAGISVSATSSCQNLAERSNSYVVEALHKKDECSFSSIRFSFGKFNKISDFPYVLKSLEKAIAGATNKRISLL